MFPLRSCIWVYIRQVPALWQEHLAHWRYFEYWPTRLFYLPIYAKVLSCAVRLRCLSFMSLVNPGIEFGGLLNYSKSKILARLPPEKCLRSCVLSCDVSMPCVREAMQQSGLVFPLVAKPDCGERGFGVEIIADIATLEHYFGRFRALSTVSGDIPTAIILQEYFHPAQEFAVLYSIAPSQLECGQPGQIDSVCAKEPLAVTGDGRSALWQLVAAHPRASKRFRLLRRSWACGWHQVPAAGVRQQLTRIGAHSLGTDFYDWSAKNSPQLLQIFAELTQSLNPEHGIPYFCFGRYDILAKDWAAVLRGEFKVIELNGVNAEPIHIYQPQYSLWRAWKTLWQHWQRIGDIALELRHRGVTACGTCVLLRAIGQHDRKVKRLKGRKEHTGT